MIDNPAVLALQVTRMIRDRREAITECCALLVAARSDNPPGDTREAAAVVAATLGDLGIDAQYVSSLPTMPSVVAVVDSLRPGPHLILNVHLDTMPAGDERTWSVDPYRLTRRDGRLYGLGMGNMKGSVAAMAHALGVLAELRDQWAGRVTFTAVSDEVVFGPNGAAHLLEMIPGIEGDALICGEGPGFARLSIGEKGVLWLAITAQGTAGHSSSVRQGSSASARLAEVVMRIDELNGERAEIPRELRGLFIEDDPAFALSVNVGTLSAGTFVGQVAVHGRAEVDLRLPPGTTADGVEARIRQVCSAVPGIEVSRIKGWDPNWTVPSSDICRAWHAAEDALGYAHAPYAIRLPASDASRWRTRGVPALCFGPQPVHSSGVDDFAEEAEVIRCAELFALTSLGFLRGAR